MIRSPLLLGDKLKRVINRDVILLSHVAFSVIALIDIQQHSSGDSWLQQWPAICLLILFTAVGLARFLNILNINSRPAIYLGFYHIMIGIGLVWLAPVGSIYTYAWLTILFITNFYYGFKVALGSMLVLLIVLELQLVRVALDGLLTQTVLVSSLAQYVVIGVIAILFMDTQVVSDQDRKLLITSMSKAQLERQRLISLINSMHDGVIATDDNGVVRLYNAASLSILNTNLDISTKKLSECMHIEDKNGKRLNIIKWAAATGTNVMSTDFKLKYSDTEYINLYLTVSPIRLGFRHEAEKGYIISFRDITREKSLEEERDEFISVISHELRTPVAITEASISNVRFILEHDQNKSAINAALDSAYKQILFLANMLNDLSTLSRAERGRLEFEPEIINPKDLLHTLSEDYDGEAKQKGLKLVSHVARNTPIAITSNKLYVREVLQNFITNSIKYTQKGSIVISVKADEGGVLFVVEDTGIGISQADQKKIFDKFYRSEDYRTRENSGTGLGLYITKKLARLIEAKISVDSELNKGSKFSIFIPDLSSRYPNAKVARKPTVSSRSA